jgi:hypothetical protein
MEEEPSTICVRQTDSKRGLTFKMAVQKADFGVLDLALQIEVSSWYFDFKIRARLLVEP